MSTQINNPSAEGQVNSVAKQPSRPAVKLFKASRGMLGIGESSHTLSITGLGAVVHDFNEFAYNVLEPFCREYLRAAYEVTPDNKKADKLSEFSRAATEMWNVALNLGATSGGVQYLSPSDEQVSIAGIRLLPRDLHAEPLWMIASSQMLQDSIPLPEGFTTIGFYGQSRYYAKAGTAALVIAQQLTGREAESADCNFAIEAFSPSEIDGMFNDVKGYMEKHPDVDPRFIRAAMRATLLGFHVKTGTKVIHTLSQSNWIRDDADRVAAAK